MNVVEFALSNMDYTKDAIARDTYHSNAIEGNTLSFEETYDIIYNNNFGKTWNKPSRELTEAINHSSAVLLVIQRVRKKKDIDENFIKKLAKTINKNLRDDRGYRRAMVDVKGSTYVMPPPELVPMQMLHLVDEYNKDTQEIFTKIAKFHIEFEKIHPFADGSGRVGRLLIDYELLRCNLPPVIIENQDKERYFDYLRTFDEIGLANWLEELSKKEGKILEDYGYIR